MPLRAADGVSIFGAAYVYCPLADYSQPGFFVSVDREGGAV